MINMNPGAWLVEREDPEEARNRMHRVALFEARIATEYHESVAETAGSAAPIRRIAMALTGRGSGVDLSACSTCA